eukprot:764657-Hanusia_phi.AAC.3
MGRRGPGEQEAPSDLPDQPDGCACLLHVDSALRRPQGVTLVEDYQLPGPAQQVRAKPMEHLVGDDDDLWSLRRRPVCGGKDDMDVCWQQKRQPLLTLLRPPQPQRRRNDNEQGVGVQASSCRQCLHRLTQPHLIRYHAAAPPRQHKPDPIDLIRTERIPHAHRQPRQHHFPLLLPHVLSKHLSPQLVQGSDCHCRKTLHADPMEAGDPPEHLAVILQPEHNALPPVIPRSKREGSAVGSQKPCLLQHLL